MSVAVERRAPDPWWSALGRWPTGAKLFLILSAALLPLAIIATLATNQVVGALDIEYRARLHVAGAESSRALAIELVGDATALRAAAAALAADPADAPSCARVSGVFAQQAPNGVRFSITDRDGRVLCGGAVPRPATLALPDPGRSLTAAGSSDGRLVLNLTGGGGRTVAIASYPAAFLAAISRPSGLGSDFGETLVIDGAAELPLATVPAGGGWRRQAITTPLQLDGLALRLSARSAPVTLPLVIALLLPWFMWGAAAGIGWFVVDRLLIRPLRRLRADVATFTPGEVIDPAALSTLPAQEIRELGDTFRAISRTVALHEAGLAEGLVRQTRLTREVHHRVKNNLQVISSLINIHARGARTAEATGAYSTIQRRVDALAVVHRNHYAESEDMRGLSLRAVIGELASNIRASAPEGAPLGITIDIDPYLVNQDVAVAAAFLVTETVELAITADPAAQVRVSLKPGAREGQATLRVSSRSLTDGEPLKAALAQRYGRVMEGLARQLRAPLHHDPLVGAYEIAIAVMGRA